LQDYHEIEGRTAPGHLASQDDCDKLVKNSDMWFSESDVCQFLNRKEEEDDEPQISE
jgi:hypothetical protein